MGETARKPSPNKDVLKRFERKSREVKPVAPDAPDSKVDPNKDEAYEEVQDMIAEMRKPMEAERADLAAKQIMKDGFEDRARITEIIDNRDFEDIYQTEDKIEKTQVDPERTVANGRKVSELSVGEVLKTVIEPTISRSPDFQAAGQAFIKDHGETTQEINMEGISGLEAHNSDEIPVADQVLAKSESNDESGKGITGLEELNKGETYIPESEAPALEVGDVGKEKSVEVSSTDTSGTGAVEVDPLAAEHAAAKAAKHSTIEDRMALSAFDSKIKVEKDELAEERVDEAEQLMTESLEADYDELADEIDLLQAALTKAEKASDEKKSAELMDDLHRTALEMQGIQKELIERDEKEAEVLAELEAKAEEVAKEADIDALQEMAAADAAAEDAIKAEAKAESQKVIDEAADLAAQLRGEKPIETTQKKPKISMDEKLQARQAEVKADKEAASKAAEIEKTNQEILAKGQETAAVAEVEATVEAEDESSEDVAERLGYESAEQAEEAQSLGEQMQALMKDKKSISAEDFARRKAELLKKVTEVTKVKFEKSEHAPAEVVEEAAPEAPESKFEQLKPKQNISVEMTPALMTALKSIKTKLPTSYGAMANGGAVNMRFLGRGSTGKYEFLLPESITALAGDQGQETSAHVIRIEEADMEKIMAGNEAFLETLAIEEDQPPLRKAA